MFVAMFFAIGQPTSKIFIKIRLISNNTCTRLPPHAALPPAAVPHPASAVLPPVVLFQAAVLRRAVALLAAAVEPS